ncbi:MAG: polyhydroxyalkanoate depolymerase [Pseudomonadota bacterium]
MSSNFASPWQATWLYTAYELGHASVYPIRGVARSMERMLADSSSPFAELPVNRAVRASWRVVDELTKRYAKPEFGIDEVSTTHGRAAVKEVTVDSRPFCRLIRFDKSTANPGPKVLIVAPMSGHFATLLRGTVRAMAPEHDVYITDWADARTVPALAGPFDLKDYVDYLIHYFRMLGPDLHVMAVCQPAVPALVATALVAEDDNVPDPLSLTLMAGPVDPRHSPTMVNDYATTRDLAWFRRNVITYVPFPHAGALRAVYPGFLQLAGFMGMNVDAHMAAYRRYFDRLVEGDADSGEQHRRFYDEYLAVMDVTAEYFLQTIDRVFQRRLLAKGEYRHRDRLVDCAAITKTTLMTIEGEKDDICGQGQTDAAHELCTALDDTQRYRYLQAGVGHYGVFNGTRWRTEIQPRIRDMIRSNTSS